MKAERAIAHPNIVSQEEWLSARREHLAHEKELTKQSDRVHAGLRKLPMVKLKKAYEFDGPKGRVGLKDLFDGQRQLIVYHFMFDPAWDKGCPGCTGFGAVKLSGSSRRSKRGSTARITSAKIVLSVAVPNRPRPTLIPIPAVSQMPAAVVSPFTSGRSWK